MEKKLLICGSAIAVVVLVLASFSPVVGYNSVESSAKNSPLFSIRSKRAINEKSKTLTCNYLRKGQLMSFPARNSKTVQIQKMIDSIKSMDDKTFNRFIEQVAHRYRIEHKETEVNLETTIVELIRMKRNPNEFKNLYIYRENEYSLPTYWYTLCEIRNCIILIIWTIYMLIVGLTLTALDKCETLGGCP